MSKLQRYGQKGLLEAGCDEAGRGCLAGPVFAAAVILKTRGKRHPLLNDSKKLSAKQRADLRAWIEKNALAWAVAQVDPQEIDDINILNASFLAMHRAVDQLKTRPELLLIDGNRFKAYPNIPHRCEIKGDARFQSIAAASILAKEYRDAYMAELDQAFPAYQWRQNKGYPTKAHRQAIREHGSCIHHRKSFQLLPKQLEIKFD